MRFNYSFWEKESFLRKADFTIIGGGLVGVNAAISLKLALPKARIVVIERGIIPTGASTKNAGFACFGSITELLDDLHKINESEVLTLLHDRYKGLEFLRKRVGDINLLYNAVGGHEVFDIDVEVEERYRDSVSKLNGLIYQYTGLKETFSFSPSHYNFSGLSNTTIFNQYEGSIHPGLMMTKLYELAQSYAIEFFMGSSVRDVRDTGDNVLLNFGNIELVSKKIIVCTNGFTNTLFNKLPVKPARNQVLVTEEIKGLKLDSCFHYNKGYTYFRNIGKRVLIGGARDIDMDTEETSDFGVTHTIRNHLKATLTYKIGLPPETKVEYEWSGILGVGDTKSPILKKHSENIIFAVRLGGMGVALGAKLGDDAAKLLLRDNT